MDKKIFERYINRICFHFNTSHATFINWKCTTTNATHYTNRYTWNCGIFSCFLIQGATEEIVVRGWLFPVLSVRSRIWIGIVVTSFLFGFLHLLNPGITILSISNIILVGVFAAFTFWKIVVFGDMRMAFHLELGTI